MAKLMEAKDHFEKVIEGKACWDTVYLDSVISILDTLCTDLPAASRYDMPMKPFNALLQV